MCEVQVQRTRKAKAMFMKFKKDPWVTKLGKFLRNTSIDKIPQLINILRGDMSFVGNRPLPPYEAEKLTTLSYARRFEAPVGLTGLWQVTKRGRSAVSDFAHGAAMLVKRAVVEQVGLLPELYFLYYEELDWCCRIRQAGYKIYYQPSALVYHKESVTVDRESSLKLYYQIRNWILFMRRNISVLPLCIFLLYYATLAFPKALITCRTGN